MQQPDKYSHDPEPHQDTIQIGDHTSVFDGPQQGLMGKIIWIESLMLWIEPLTLPCNFPQQDEVTNIKPEGPGSWCIHIHKDEVVIEPPPMLKFSSKCSYDVTLGNVVQVMRGEYCGQMGTVINVLFQNASMDIRCGDFTMVCSCIFFLLCSDKCF